MLVAAYAGMQLRRVRRAIGALLVRTVAAQFGIVIHALRQYHHAHHGGRRGRGPGSCWTGVKALSHPAGVMHSDARLLAQFRFHSGLPETIQRVLVRGAHPISKLQARRLAHRCRRPLLRPPEVGCLTRRRSEQNAANARGLRYDGRRGRSPCHARTRGGESNAMGIAAEIGQYLLGACERALGVDHPFNRTEPIETVGKGGGFGQGSECAGEA